jgi:hypothetical protein
MSQELSQSAAEANGGSGPHAVGASHSDMVFTLPSQNVMTSISAAPPGPESGAIQPQAIHPRLSLQYFEPEGFIEVIFV